MNQTKILDVKVNNTIAKEVLEKIKSFLLSNQQHYIITLNPEMVVEAQKDNHFKKIINEADIVVPDGTGIMFANKFLNHKILSEKITGIDLIYRICESEFIKDKKIYLLGAGEGIAEETSEVLSKKYDCLNIVGAEEGIRFEIPNTKYQTPNKSQNLECHSELVSESTKIIRLINFKIIRQVIKRMGKTCGYKQKILKQVQNDNQIYVSCNNLIQRINKTQPDVLFVAFGAPKQDKWIYENLKKMPSVRLAIGVGGSFDFISGKTKRAPFIFQKLGIEWSYRLFQEPRRIKRIYNATVKFGWMVLRRSFKNVDI